MSAKQTKAIQDKWEKCLSEFSKELKNSFMQPCLDYGKYVIKDVKHEGECLIPIEYANLTEGKIIRRKTGFYARLSASGYMDCTEWQSIDSPDDVDDFFNTFVAME